MGMIKLTENEVKYLNNFVKKGRKSARELTRAQQFPLRLYTHTAKGLLRITILYFRRYYV